MWRALLSAIGFLTRLPVPHVTLDEADVALGAGFFAWVGAMIAGLLWLASIALHPLSSSVSAMSIVALWAFLTGALHLDGLADTVDGLSGGHGDRERTLTIMRDSRIGAHGAVAVCLGLGLKWAALEQAFQARDLGWVVAPIAARFACTWLLATFPYAREQGLGSAFAGRVGVREVALGAGVLVPLYFVLGGSFVVPWVVGNLAAWAVAFRVRAVLGGLTGDAQGAAIEVCEVATLLCLGLSPIWT